MAKALKKVATIVAVVAAVATVVATGGAALGLAPAVIGVASTVAAVASAVATIASLAAGLLSKPPKIQGSATSFILNPDGPMPYAMGVTFNAGSAVYRDTWGADNRYQGFVCILSAGGPIQSLDTFLIDQGAQGLSGGAATGGLADFMWDTTQLGARPEASYLAPHATPGAAPGWGASNKLSGYAADFWVLKFDTKGKKYAGGVPRRGWVMHGVKVYDPRLDSTYPGGAGSCRSNDETTWVWSENPWLHELTWEIGRRCAAGLLYLGVGQPIANIDVASYVYAANVADTNAWTISGVVYSSEDKWSVSKTIAQAGGGEPIRLLGKQSAFVESPKVSVDTITADDIIGSCSVPSDRSFQDRINRIIPKYLSEAHGWEMVPAAPISVAAYKTLDGGVDRTIEQPYRLVKTANQAAQLAIYQIAGTRERVGIVLALKPRWKGYAPGTCLTVDIPQFGLSSQKCVVLDRQEDAGARYVILTLRTETDAKHAVALAGTGVAPPGVTLTPIDLSNVAAPAGGSWTATGTTISSSGGAIPAITITGAVDNSSADQVIFEYKPTSSSTWLMGGTVDKSVTQFDLTSLAPGVAYDVRVSNVVHGVVGGTLSLGSVTAGSMIAGQDLGLVAIGTSPATIVGNTVANDTGGSTYETMVRGVAMAGACFAECDIIPGNNYTILSLDASATDKASNNQDCYAHYNPQTGLMEIFRGSTGILGATIATGLNGKMQLAYDGVRYRVFIAATEMVASLATYPGMAAATGPLTHYPKWTPYTAGSTLTGLRAGPFTDNNFGSIGGAGTPDPYSTSGDNLVSNAGLASNAARWVVSGATVQAGSAGDPAPFYFDFPAGAGATAAINDGGTVHIGGAIKIYCSGYAYKASGAGGAFQIVVEYYKADGSVSAIRTQDATSIMPGSSASWVAFSFSLTPPADAALIRAYAYGSNTTSAVRLAGGLRVAKTEPAADVTSTAKVAVEMASDKTVPAAYDGTVSSTDLGELRWSPKVTKGGVSIKGENGTTYALTNTYGGTFAVDNTNGSSTKGDITQSAITSNTAGGELTITVNGVAEPKIAFKVTKNIAAPPPPSGGSAKNISWMDGDWNGLNTTSYSTVNALKSITVASGETLYVSGILDINVGGNGGVTRTMTLKIQYSPTGANSWNDFPGGGHTSSTATSGINGGPPDYDYVEPIPGSVTMTDSKGGLSAATYDVRVVGICSATGKVCSPSGTLTVEAKV